MAKRVIFNADDLGLSAKTDGAILELAKLGVVTSASLLVNALRSASAYKSALKVGLSVGIHLNSTIFKPICVEEKYLYLFGLKGKTKRTFEERGELSDAEFGVLFEEFNAQILLFQSLFNKLPSHINFHHPLYWIKGMPQKFNDFVKKYNRPCRWFYDLGSIDIPHPDYTEFGFYDPKSLSVKALIDLLEAMPNGVSELVLHPGYFDNQIASSYITEREQQYEILSSEEFRKYLFASKIELINFDNLS